MDDDDDDDRELSCDELNFRSSLSVSMIVAPTNSLISKFSFNKSARLNFELLLKTKRLSNDLSSKTLIIFCKVVSDISTNNNNNIKNK